MTDTIHTTVNIVELIESQPIIKLSKPYHNKLLNKIKNSFTTEEQQIFITNFYTYLNYSDSDFIIDLDNIWKWIGYSKKQNAKDTLVKFFIKEIDYKIVLTLKSNQVYGGCNKEKILLTIETFKELCMEAKTETGKNIRKYYIKLEKLLNETIIEETNELKLQLEEKSNLLQNTENALESEKKKYFDFTRKRFYDTEPTHTIYIYRNNLKDENSLIKIGKTQNLKNRESDYNSCNQNGGVVYAVKCYNSDLMEKVCHHILDKYRVYKKSEWFKISEYNAKQVLNIVHLILDDLISYSEILDKKDIFSEIKNIFQENSHCAGSCTTANIEYINPYEKINNIVNEKNNEIIQVKEQNSKNPLDFDNFINDCCEISPEFYCIKVDVYGAHKLWCRNQEKKTKDALYKYCNEKFISAKKSIKEYNACLAIFRGIRVKKILFEPNDKNNLTEFEKFIIDKCKVGYTYRTSYKLINNEFINWKQETINNYTLDNITKNNLREYLNINFFPTMVYLNDNTNTEKKLLSTNSQGVWGITLLNDNTNTGIKLANKLKKKIIQIDVNTKKIINTFESLTSASQITGISASYLSTVLRFEKVKDNCIFQYADKKIIQNTSS
jgi:phage anti-repressor protein